MDTFKITIYSIKYNDLEYIGSTKNIDNRISNHMRCIKIDDGSCKLYDFMITNNLNINELSVNILDELECNDKTRRITEQFYINLYNPYFNTNNAYSIPKQKSFYTPTMKLKNKMEIKRLFKINKIKELFVKKQNELLYLNNEAFILKHLNYNDFDKFDVNISNLSSKNLFINRNIYGYLHDNNRNNTLNYKDVIVNKKYIGSLNQMVLTNELKKEYKFTQRSNIIKEHLLLNKYSFDTKNSGKLEKVYNDNKKLDDVSKYKEYKIIIKRNTKKLIKQKNEFTETLHLDLMKDLLLNYNKKTTILKIQKKKYNREKMRIIIMNWVRLLNSIYKNENKK